MNVLFDECVDFRYQKEFAREHREHMISNPQLMGWDGNSLVMQGLTKDEKDEFLARIASEVGFKVLITTDKKFLEGCSVPLDVRIIDAAPLAPDVYALRQFTPTIIKQLEQIALGHDQEPERIVLQDKSLNLELQPERTLDR